MFRGWTLAAVNIIHSKVHKIYPYYPLDKCDFQLGYLGADIKMPMTCILPVCEYVQYYAIFLPESCCNVKER